MIAEIKLPAKFVQVVREGYSDKMNADYMVAKFLVENNDDIALPELFVSTDDIPFIRSLKSQEQVTLTVGITGNNSGLTARCTKFEKMAK